MTGLSRRRFLSGTAAAAAAGLGAVACGTKNDQPPARSEHHSAIVVGSGYGGGVSALRLGQAGIDTLILEKGRHFDTPDADGKRFSKMLPPDTRASWFTVVPPSLVPSFQGISIADVVRQVPSPQPVQAGVCDNVTFGAHNVFRGIGVGGGSLINAAIAAIPTPEQIQETFPDIDPGEFLNTYIERAKNMLRTSYRDMDWFEQTPWFQYARTGRQYAAAAGYGVDYNGSAYSFDYMKQEEINAVPRSAFDLEQQYGNNYGRFGSVDATYIAAALATGKVTLSALTEVTGIRREPSGEYVVSTRVIDRWGKEVERREIGCDKLFLSAGVLGTNTILMRARESGGLNDLSEDIGRGYGNNGDVMVAHHLQDTDPSGTQQSALGMINLDGRDDPDNPVYASIFAIPLPTETHTLGYYVMVKTGDRADMSYDAKSDKIDIRWPQEYTDNLVARAKPVFDKVTQANGVEYRDDVFPGQIFAPNTVHPLGGCVRGVATDGYGRLNGYENFYVNDASLVPGYLGCNPYMSITALAERNIDGILQGRH